MFEYDEFIEDGYLWNFSPAERRRFKRQHRDLQAQMLRYQAKLAVMVAEDNPAIFANYDPKPNTPLEIKYTFNRLHMNDPRETELCLSYIDPVADKKNPYADALVWAFEDNTYCHTVILQGVQSKDRWFSRGFNDEEAGRVLDVLSGKKLKELTFTYYPLLTDVTYLKIANIMARPDNRWEHVTLGKIPVASDIAAPYDRIGKVYYTRIERQPARPSFLSRLFHRERD